MKEIIYGLYESRSCGDYEGGSSNHTHLKMTSTSKQDLVNRHNAMVDNNRAKLAGHHPSYFRHIDPYLELDLLGELKTCEFSGSTGGGYASVSCNIKIKPIPQSDDGYKYVPEVGDKVRVFDVTQHYSSRGSLDETDVGTVISATDEYVYVDVFWRKSPLRIKRCHIGYSLRDDRWEGNTMSLVKREDKRAKAEADQYRRAAAEREKEFMKGRRNPRI